VTVSTKLLLVYIFFKRQ